MTLQEKINHALEHAFDNGNKGVNYSKAAKALKVSRPAVMAWYKGEVDLYQIQLKNLISLAHATKKPAHWFLQDDNNQKYPMIAEPAAHNHDEHTLSKDAQALINEIKKLSKTKLLTDESIRLMTQMIKHISSTQTQAPS